MSNSELPAYSPASLKPTLPTATGRYDIRLRLERKSAIIEPGQFLSTELASTPPYLPPHWAAFIHPEGNTYFHRSSGLSVVTESYMYDPTVAQHICMWAGIAEKLVMDQKLDLPNTVELFLKLEGQRCSYYFVDRATKAVFWLEQVDTDKLGLNETVSTSHLKVILESEFWTHTESRCMHFGGLPQKDIDDLILVFSHGFIDTITSRTSTFPWESAECERFVNILTSSRDKIHEGYTTCIVARLWSIIAMVRYENSYGQEQARLDREVTLRVDNYKEPQWVQVLASRITLGMSVPYSTRLNQMFGEEVLYSWDWKSFITSTVKDWQITAAKSSVILSLQIASFSLPALPALTYVSASCAIFSLFLSSLLIHKHHSLRNAGIDGGHLYLRTVRSQRVKFQGVAFVYALPETIFVVALLSSLSQAAYILSHYVPLEFLILYGAVLAFVLFLTHYATSGIQIQIQRPTLLSIFERTKDEAHMV